ncbi:MULTISPECIES: hypothetical protein [unclassified Nodosilinea]|uniref:SPOR domain-containing protein n=1 Tax=Leptolyngbya subtilissima DQ-A4 TaxID=2933933 RepID=A0ABV0JZ89_9CYAN|nr:MULTISPECIES: hypothetical protein [unclassified Nodosilinea]MBD2109881.1 hypothetical protein [Nodosilinea sp. FACHB-13]MBD2112432.1 hypothetical protein [Nodosilinea sp. FACHB-141]
MLAPLAGVWTAAQAQFPPCPPPSANEYLLLVRSNTEAERTRVQDLLPSNSTVLVCDYLNDTVVRAGGFTNLENANAWAQYMTEVEGFQAFVARPATTAAQPAPPTGGTTPPANSETPPANNTPPSGGTPATATPPATTQSAPTAYAPQPLGTGFAVLVDYQYQPESAIAIQRQVGQAVGLAVHRQRSYLLIAHSPDVAGAASTLSVLTSLNIAGFIVDSQEVVMLTPAVALTAP